MPKYLKLLISDYGKAGRDRREVTLLDEMGAEVVVFSKGAKTTVRNEGRVTVYEEPTYKSHRFSSINHLTSFVQRLRMLEGFEFDVISCHDLTMLAIGYFASRKRKPKPKVVYDAHEYEIGRNVKRNKLMVAAIAWLERFLMSKSAFTMVVNDSIADEMVRVHKLAVRPVVVRSTPPLWKRDDDEVVENRKLFCELLGIDPDDAFVIMYHGVIAPGRGVETVIKVVAQDPTLHAVVLGNGEDSYLDSLRSFAENSGAASRIIFVPAVPRDCLEYFVAAADVGMVTVEAVSKSYYYMLPNKFFENVQAEVPIVASDFPETSRLVREYDIGELCDPSDISSVSTAVATLRNDPDRYAQCKANLRRAKRELCWEEEKQVLEEAYAKIFEGIERERSVEDRRLPQCHKD